MMLACLGQTKKIGFDKRIKYFGQYKFEHMQENEDEREGSKQDASLFVVERRSRKWSKFFENSIVT